MKNFTADWKNFERSGHFLALTRAWENSIPQSKSLTLASGLKIKLIDTGILQIEPEKPGATRVLISSGIHGNETAPIEIVEQMVNDIWCGKLNVKVKLLLIIGNPAAVNLGQRFVSQNLNRLFSARHKQSPQRDYETKRAQVIEQVTSSFFQTKNQTKIEPLHYHFDLHTAIRASKYKKFVVYPFIHNKPWNKNHMAFFGAANINTILLGNQPAGTFSYYTSYQFKALSATVELGKVRPFGQNDMQQFSAIVENLNNLIQRKTVKLKTFNNKEYRVYRVKQEIIKENESYRLLLDDKVENFTSFKKGTLLASDGGDKKYIVENDGEAIVFPNNKVPVGQRVGVLIETIDL